MIYRKNMTEPILNIEHLKIEFNTRRGTLVAVDDISFNVLPGEYTVVIKEKADDRQDAGMILFAETLAIDAA